MIRGAFYDDGQVTIHCADAREVTLDPATVAAVVTSPPNNVGLAYASGSDLVPWVDYWRMAADTAETMTGALVPGGERGSTRRCRCPRSPVRRATSAG